MPMALEKYWNVSLMEIDIRDEYLIVKDGDLAGMGAHSYTKGSTTGGSEEAAKYKNTDFKIFGKPSTRKYRLQHCSLHCSCSLIYHILVLLSDYEKKKVIYQKT